MGSQSQFLNILREEILIPRFNALVEHGESYVSRNFEEISQRMAWYNTVKLYKAKFNTSDIDLKGNSNSQYSKFLKAIRGFCEGKKNVEKVEKVNPRYGQYWGIFRKALNIEAKGRAIAFGCAGNDLMVVPSNQYQYIDKGLLCVICEKETLGKKFLKEMENRGWDSKILLIITQGFSACEVIETLLEIKENIQDGNTNFHVGVLHDNDVAGITIFQDVKKWFPETMDLGINFEMLDDISPDLWDNIKEESGLSSNEKKTMINLGLEDDLARLGNYRLELDNLFVNSGIGVFADYAEKVIQRECKVWDLNRYRSPSSSRPDRVDELEERVNSIWDKICIAVLGCKSWKYEWTQPSNTKKIEFKKDNITYNGDVKDAYTQIRLQSQKLQEIVDNDSDNVSKMNQIEEIIDSLGLDKIEEMIESNNEEDEEDEDY